MKRKNMDCSEAEKQFVEDVKQRMKTVYKPLSDKDIVIWGIGDYGDFLFHVLSDMSLEEKIRCFCDDRDSVHNTRFHGYPVKKVHEIMEEYPKATYALASSYYNEIRKGIPKTIRSKIELFDIPQYPEREIEIAAATNTYTVKTDPLIYIKKWFSIYAERDESGQIDEMLSTVCDLLEDEESKEILRKRVSFFTTGKLGYLLSIKKTLPIYFDRDYFPEIGKDEVFFDLGGYTGDSTMGFIQYSNGKYKKIHIFEPDEANYAVCLTNINNLACKNVFFHKSGTGKENGELSFSNDGTSGARVKEDGNIKVKIERLDDYFDEKPSFIKMDIEGAELDTLVGAERVIQEYKPKLAISIYHKPFDFYDIPVFLKSLVPEYHFKVRHHTDYLYDTVLYAYTK